MNARVVFLCAFVLGSWGTSAFAQFPFSSGSTSSSQQRPLFFSGQADGPLFAVGVVSHPGFDGNVRGLKSLLLKIPYLCNLKTDPVPRLVDLKRKVEVTANPFLVLTGKGAFRPSPAEIANLRAFLLLGGLLFADDPTANYASPFSTSVREVFGSMFPRRALEKIERGHVVFQTFYLLDSAVGRVIERPYLERMDIDGRGALILSYNDMIGSWEKDLLGTYVYSVSPGGERQRTLSLRLGVNIVFYALTLDYKADQVHIPDILKRRKLLRR